MRPRNPFGLGVNLAIAATAASEPRIVVVIGEPMADDPPGRPAPTPPPARGAVEFDAIRVRQAEDKRARKGARLKAAVAKGAMQGDPR